MIHLIAQTVSDEQQQFNHIFISPPDPLLVAFEWATWLLGAFCAVQLVLHVVLCVRPSSAVLGGTARPVVVLKIMVLYFVASLIVGLYNAIELLSDHVAAGGKPDPVMVSAGIRNSLVYLLRGMIGLFVGLFDYFAFAGKYARLQTAASDVNEAA